MHSKWNKKYVVLLTIGIALVILLLIINSFKRESIKKEIHTIDLSKGTVLLVKNNDQNILIGGGSLAEAKELYDYLRKQEVTRIDLAVWTKPTEDITGAYSELVYYIPIQELYIYQEEKIDDFSKQLQNELIKVQCKVTSAQGVIPFKTKTNQFYINPLLVGQVENSIHPLLIIEVGFDDLSYLWIPNNEQLKHISQLEDKSQLEQIAPHILNIGGQYRSTLLEDMPINQTNLKAIIIGDQRGLNQEERQSVQKFAENKLVLEMQQEKRIILYNTRIFYDILTSKGMSVKVL